MTLLCIYYDTTVYLLYYYGVFSSCQGIKGKDDMLEDSDEDQHDAYLERMKEEGKIREEANDSDDSDEESGDRRLGQSDGESSE